MYRVILIPKAEKQLEKLERRYQERITAALLKLKEHPFSGKKLEGELEGGRAIRVWPYRIIYTVDKKIITVTVVAIGHRKDVYAL